MDQEEKIPAELQEKLNDVEKKADLEERKNFRFDCEKGVMVGAICFGLAFTLGIAMRAGTLNALIFGVFTGAVGFLTAACQKPRKK